MSAKPAYIVVMNGRPRPFGRLSEKQLAFACRAAGNARRLLAKITNQRKLDPATRHELSATTSLIRRIAAQLEAEEALRRRRHLFAEANRNSEGGVA